MIGTTFITLASYDWQMLPSSIASYYDQADEILIGLDLERRSWSGHPFELERQEIKDTLAPIDHEKKIKLVEGFFSNPDLTPIQNDTAERAALAAQAEPKHVIVEVDADEILLDAALVRQAVEELPSGLQLFASEWITVFKVIGDTALVVTPSLQPVALGTHARTRRYARQTGEMPHLVDTCVEHLTLGRSAADVEVKLKSWSHSHQVRPGYFYFWKSVTLENYQEARDVHPFTKGVWPGLKTVPVAELAWGQYLQGM